MTGRHFTTCLAVGLWVMVGCAEQTPDPRLDSIEPAMVTSLVETAATVHGLDLAAMAHLDLDSTAAMIDRGWRVHIAGVPVTTTWRDQAQLDVVIPRGFAAGVHDVLAIAPDGRTLILTSALTVTGEPVGLRLSIEDARGGTGQPIGGLRTAGDQGVAFAVVRAPTGAFVGDVPVTWGTTGAFAVIEPSDGHAVFEARIVGSGRVTAHHAGADLYAESDELTTIAGDATRIAIADAPGGAGTVIGDRSGLTTDTGGGLVAYVIAIDAFDNATGDVAAPWTFTGVTGSVVGAVVDFTTPGAGQLHANDAVLGTASTGTLTVAPGRAATLVIAPAMLDVVAGAPDVPFSATGTDGDGNATLDLGTLGWTIANGPIAQIHATTGMLTPTASGTGAIRATSSHGAFGDSGAVRIRGAAALTAALVAPVQVGVGTNFTVSMTTTNTGENDAVTVVPCAIALGGTGGAAITATPASVPVLAAGGSTISTWSLTATAAGTLTFTTCATASDATTFAAITTSALGASSDIADLVSDVYLVAADPFGDGTRFGFVTGYQDQIYLGPNATGRSAVRLASPAAVPESLSFLFARDDTDNTADNSSTAPYTSIGSLGCVHDTATCGPNNEDQRGMFRSVVVSGVEWLIASGAHADNNARYLYMTTDTDAVLDFLYVDLTPLIVQAHGVSALAGVGDRLYVGTSGDSSQLIALTTMPVAPGLDALPADARGMRLDRLTGWDNGGFPINVDAIAGVGDLTYVANKNLWVRATMSSPGPMLGSCLPPLCNQPWIDITPSAAAYASRPSYETDKGGELEPADRAIVGIVPFGGRIFVARNTTSGPQLWSCLATGPVCNASDWNLVAANTAGDTLLTQFNDPSFSKVSLLAATSSYLYVGFDSAAGAQVFRTANPAAAAPADFAALGGPGLGTPANTRIFDAKAITTSGTTAIWVTAGNATSPLSLLVIP